MTKTQSIALATALALSPLSLLPVIMSNHSAVAYAAPVDQFSQHDFPCEEDEVLGYAPRFGPDRVGCMHIEEFTGPNVVAVGPNAYDMGAYVGGYN